MGAGRPRGSGRAPGAGAPRSPPPRSRRSRSRSSSSRRAAASRSSRRRSGPRSRRAVLVAALLPARERALRDRRAALRARCSSPRSSSTTPLGGNATRLGALAAGPGRARRAARPAQPARCVAALALPLAYWPLYPAVRDVVRASGDPSVHAAYYAPLLRLPASRAPGGSFRVEIPFTENHWEARHVAPRRSRSRAAGSASSTAATARSSTTARLDAARYRAWLDEHAVAYVARARRRARRRRRATRRGSSRRGLPYLRPVWRDAHWRVFAVARPAPLAQAAARRRATATLSPTGVTRARHARPAPCSCACASRAGGG